MWTLETRWFDVAVFMSLFTVGSILFGHFEQYKPAWRRLLKPAIFLSLLLVLTQTAGRAWAYGVMSIPLLGALWVHAYWLPKHGISGWTAEPRDKYIELMRSRSRSK